MLSRRKRWSGDVLLGLRRLLILDFASLKPLSGIAQGGRDGQPSTFHVPPSWHMLQLHSNEWRLYWKAAGIPFLER